MLLSAMSCSCKHGRQRRVERGSDQISEFQTPARGATHARTGRKTIRQHPRQQCQSPDSSRSKTITVAGCARLHASIRVAACD